MNMFIQAVHSEVVDELFEPEVRQHNQQVDELINQNNQLLGVFNDGFNYLGISYGYAGRHTRHVPPLDSRYHGEMARLLSHRKAVAQDRTFISQLLFKLLDPCEGNQDARNALPECLVGFYPGLAHFERTDQAAWSIQHNPRDMRQYLKLLPKIEMYCALRLVY